MLSRNALSLVASLALFALPGCGSGSADTGTGAQGNNDGLAGDAPAQGGFDPYTAERQHCVDGINSYRAKVNAPPLKASDKIEAFADTAAKYDADHGAHAYFSKTAGGNGTAFAENAAPGWPRKDFTSLDNLVDHALAAMWDEGPGGGHYDNMASTKYTQVGCGFFVTSDGKVWALQDFR
jgi:uncharacterized protein YkwD